MIIIKTKVYTKKKIYFLSSSQLLTVGESSNILLLFCSAHWAQKNQGWEFALWFFERIARVLRAKERNSDSVFEKSDRAKSDGTDLLLGIKRGKAFNYCMCALCIVQYCNIKSVLDWSIKLNMITAAESLGIFR